jgi:signal transduction histidine kinase/CheY-like chemotaxis protein
MTWFLSDDASSSGPSRGDDAPFRDATVARRPPLNIERALLDATTSMAWAVDRDYRLLTSNIAFQAAMAANTGRPARTGESMLRAEFPASVLAHWRAHYDAAFAGTTGEYVSEMPTISGTMLLELVTSPLRDVDGTIIGCAAVCRDLRAQSSAERELLDRMALDEELFVEHPIPMWIVDRDSRNFLSVNRAATDRYGWTTAQFLRMSADDLHADSMATTTSSRVGEQEPSGRTHRPSRHLLANGRSIDVEEYTSRVTFRGRPAQLVAVVLRQVETATDAGSRPPDSVLYRAAEAMTIGLVLLDGEGTIRWANRASREMVGSSVLGDDLVWVHPAELASVRARRVGYLQGAHHLGAATDVRFLQPDGCTIWATVCVVPMPGADSDEIRHLVTITDRTSDVRRRDAVDETQSRLQRQQRLESLGALAAGLSHEFRNLLSVIGGHLELLGMYAPGDAGYRSSLAMLTDVTRRGHELTKSMLDFTSGSERSASTWSDAMAHIRAAVRIAQASAAGAVVSTDLPASDIETALSGSEWMQLLVNAMQNSARAVRERPDPSIGVGAALVSLDDVLHLATGSIDAGQYLRVSVRDNGTGVTAEQLSRLFEPFFTTRADDGGTGLGLSVVATIVRRAGGAADVASVEGVGTSILFYVPARGGAVALQAPSTRTGRRALVLSTSFARKRAIEFELLRASWRAVVTADPKIATALVRGEPFGYDVVYIDFDLDRITGLDVADEIVRLAPDVPIVLGTVDDVTLAPAALSARGIVRVITDSRDVSTVPPALLSAARDRTSGE